MADTTAPGAPICAITNATYMVGAGMSTAAQRWVKALAADCDALIYSDGLLVVMGNSMMSGKDYSYYRAERKLGQSPSAIHGARVRRVSETPLEQLLTANRRNRMVPTDEIASARLKLRWKVCSLTVHMHDGERLKFTWLNHSLHYADFNEITTALASVLGGRLESAGHRDSPGGP